MPLREMKYIFDALEDTSRKTYNKKKCVLSARDDQAVMRHTRGEGSVKLDVYVSSIPSSVMGALIPNPISVRSLSKHGGR